jgi:hypothetical protein
MQLFCPASWNAIIIRELNKRRLCLVVWRTRAYVVLSESKKEKMKLTFSRKQISQTPGFCSYLAANDILQRKNLFAGLVYTPTFQITTVYIQTQNTKAACFLQPIYPWNNCSLQR